MSSPQDPAGAPGGAPQGPPPEYAPPPVPEPSPGPGPQRTPRPGFPPYAPPTYPGYGAPRKALDLSKPVTIAAWVVLGLYAVNDLYGRTQIHAYAGDVGDRYFGGMSPLGTGVFSAGVLLAVGVWLRGREADD